MMNRITKKLSGLTLCLFCLGGAMAQTTFDFDTNYATLFPTLKGTSSTSSTAGDITAATTCTLDGINLTVSAKTSSSNENRIWSKSPRLRMYSGTLKIDAPAGSSLTSVVFNNGKWNSGNTFDSGTFATTNNTWTAANSTTTSLVLTVNANTQIKSIVVTLASSDPTAVAAPTITGTTSFETSTDVTVAGADGSVVYYTTDGTEPTTSSTNNGTNTVTFTLDHTATVKAIAVKGGKTSTVASSDFTKISFKDETIASLNKLTANEANVKLTLTNAKVVYVSSTKVYVREGDDAICFYGTGLTLKQNDVINGTVKVAFSLYNGLPEVGKSTSTNADNLTITSSTEEAQPREVTLADVNAGKYLSDLVTVKGITVSSETSGTSTTYYANLGSVKVQLYGADDVVKSYAGDGKTYDLKAVVTIYNTTHEMLPISLTPSIQNVTLDESKDYTPSAATANVSFVRTFVANKWATLCVPFNVANSDIATVFGTSAQVANYTGVTLEDNGNVSLLFSTQNAQIEANKPCLIKVVSTAASYTAQNVTLTTDAAGTLSFTSKDTKGNSVTATMTGSYAKIEKLPSDGKAYVINDDKFYLVNSNVSLKPFHAYFSLDKSTASSVKALNVNIDGISTAVEGISADANDAPMDVYNLNGQLVRRNATSLSGLSKGVYIVKGMKKAVK
jgi:hypothetical protein